MNSIPSPPPSSSSSSNFTLFTHSKTPNYLFKFSLKIPILPFHSSSSHLTSHPPCCTLGDSTSLLDKNAPPSEHISRNDVPPKEMLVVRRPVKEFSGEVSDEEEEVKETVEDKIKGSSIDDGLTNFAKKMPMFEPERVESDSTEKPLTVNLDLSLYKAKVLGRSFRYEEAEAILQKVRYLRIILMFRVDI